MLIQLIVNLPRYGLHENQIVEVRTGGNYHRGGAKWWIEDGDEIIPIMAWEAKFVSYGIAPSPEEIQRIKKSGRWPPTNKGGY